MSARMADPVVPILDTHTIRRLSVESCRDPRVVRGVLLGHPSTATSYGAVVAAVERLHLGIAVPPRVVRLTARQSDPPPRAA
jgi:hypothetical protein